MDSTVKAFKEAIKDWLKKNNQPEVSIDFCTDFAFDDELNTLYIGVEEYAYMDACFQEYIAEHGCDWEGIPGPVLAFLHELGHAHTIKDFNFEQRAFCQFSKSLIDVRDDLDEKEAIFAYWEVPDEWAANEWAIKFINENVDAVNDLVVAYATAWNDMVNAIDVFTIAKTFEEVYERSIA